MFLFLMEGVFPASVAQLFRRETRAPQWENDFNTFSAYNSQYIMIFFGYSPMLGHFGGI